MKTAYINICLRPDSARRQIPVGLAFVLTATARAGFEFDLIDMDIEPMTMNELREQLEQGNYDAVGLGCIVTGFHQTREIASIIKQVNPNTVIFAGNSVSTSVPELLLRNTDVDIAVIGEGDETVVELLRALESGSSLAGIPGLAYLEDGNYRFTGHRPLLPDLDAIGHPDWHLFDLEKYQNFGHVNSNTFGDFGEVRAFPLNTARGCPHNCTFCYHVFKGQKYRRYSDACIMEEIVRMRDALDINFFSLWDELSFPTPKSIEGFLEALGGLGFSVGWEATCRAGLFKKEHLQLIRDMKAMGCDSMSFSLENASEEILAAMHKNITVDAFIEQAKVLRKGGVVPTTSVIFGYPQETPESIAKTLEVCRQCGIYPSVGFLLPLPGTPIYDWANEQGIIGDEVDYLMRIGDRQDFHINLTQMSDEELVGTVSDGLEELAATLGIEVASVFKTTTYQTAKNLDQDDDQE